MKNINFYKIQQAILEAVHERNVVLHKENFAALILRMLKQQHLLCERSCASTVSPVKMKNNTQSSKAAFSTDGCPELRSHRISVCVSPDTRVPACGREENSVFSKPNTPNCSLQLLGRNHPVYWKAERAKFAVSFLEIWKKARKKKYSDLCPQ